MKTDMDLQFLQYCNNEDLRALCDILVYDNKGELRLSESLSISDSYLSCYPGTNFCIGEGMMMILQVIATDSGYGIKWKLDN